MHDRKFKMLGIRLLAVVAIATLVMLLWNALLPAIFGVQSIGFFQALGLLILCKILFGGIGYRGFFGRHGREMRERWLAMSQEQRDAFFHQRGFGPHGDHCGHRFHHGPFAHRRGRHQACHDSQDDAPVPSDKPADQSGKTE
ncbi:hypothetical protein CS369_17515 [Candidatus Symbiopectobacterium sp. 'North America']|uniref:hypothetical protein n=1 Tax=Candidatus Symbiopectobacterium sp. 'North America' TaxID=2794574 RepID=UPI0018CB1B72|nr:hypothetical protein [Candidatus Symbiopectobacterium sp. 'North America']